MKLRANDITPNESERGIFTKDSIQDCILPRGPPIVTLTLNEGVSSFMHNTSNVFGECITNAQKKMTISEGKGSSTKVQDILILWRALSLERSN